MRILTTALLLCCLVAPEAAAQGGLSAAHFGGGFGISLPTGALSRSHSAGFNLTASAAYQVPGQAMGIRGELFYERFPAKTAQSGASASQAVAAIVNAEYDFQGASFHPYLIGGMGVYHLNGAGTHPGLNGGAGIRIPLAGMTAYFEARLHKLLIDGTSYVSCPITFGLSF